MAKGKGLRKLPGSFVDGKPQPSLYTTDPTIATPSQLTAIAKNIKEARRQVRGSKPKINVPGGFVKTELQKANTSSPEPSIGAIKAAIANARDEIKGKKKDISVGGGSIKTTLEPASTSAPKRGTRLSAVAGGRTKKAGSGRTIADPIISGGKVHTSKINPKFDRLDALTAAQKKSMSMERQRIDALGQVALENEDYLLALEAMNRKQLVEPEQNRMRALYRRFDHYYHPGTFTLGGADHWAEDPSARLSGRSHVSVNLHSSYVSIPASLQAVTPVVNYVPTGPSMAERNQAARRERIFYAWWDANDFDLRLEEACLLKALYGTTAAKIYWDPVKKMPRVQIVDTPENLYLGYGNSDYSRIDWAIYSYGLSPQAVLEDFGVDVIPVRDGNQWFPYTSSSTHDDPIASIYLNSYHRDPIRYQTAYDQMKIEVIDYWYKHATEPGKAPLVCNALIVGNTVVKRTEHPEFEGVIPYVLLRNSMIPGSPYGKPELYDIEQLLREKDEKITAQAQMIHSVVGGQMWQLVGAEAPDEVPANAIPKPNQVATPGAGNRIESINPFIPQFQVEDYNKRIDRELAVASGLNDLLLGLAPSSVLGSSRAIAQLMANYEARISPKRKILYSWVNQVWELCARIWENKDRAVGNIINGEYTLAITPPELTPRDTIELAQTAINLVQNRLWSAERAMDRMGVSDPEGEKDMIRDEQTDATLNPAAVQTMGALIQMFAQMQQQPPAAAEQQAQAGQARAMEAMASLNPPAGGTEMLNSPSEQGNPPQESLPQNAQGGGADLMAMLQAAQGGVPQQGGE
jgi:hypothetical protein